MFCQNLNNREEKFHDFSLNLAVTWKIFVSFLIFMWQIYLKIRLTEKV